MVNRKKHAPRKTTSFHITYFSEATQKKLSTLIEASNGHDAQDIFHEQYDPLMFRILGCYMA